MQPISSLRRAAFLWCVLAGGLALPCLAADQQRLPIEVEAALARAKIPPEAVSVVVQEAGAAGSRLAWRATQASNPASVTKLVTTLAALELLGPTWTWSTPVWLQGRQGAQGVLEGDLVIKGSGDPSLVVERIWLLLRRVQQAGVREIKGDIVLDRTAFRVADQSPADFDGEPLRPYNAQPDALLLNYRALTLGFAPQAGRGVAAVGVEPPLAGVDVDKSVALRAAGACGDWRTDLKLDASDPSRIRLRGSLATACGEKSWPLAYADPASYNARVLEAMWREMGGRLAGRVRDGLAPATAPSFEFESPPLGAVVRDINKFSNNVMAQQLFLTLGLQAQGVGSEQTAREAVGAWLHDAIGARADGVVIDNGSGLSRDTRISADTLAALLQSAWKSPVMPEFIASLPILSQDGTLRRAKGPAAARFAGRAHLKTGSLQGVVAIAGYLLTPDARRYVIVAIVNHPNAQAARPALDALLDWAMRADPAVPR
jgi:D-alanyl-D-alanine carboxypeptidase/D-alanyl-D-alanine-endopeptidase (penicillin-binding protein 4)